jgi:hypothetical protein
MYNISEILIIPLLGFIIIINSKSVINYLNPTFSFFTVYFKKKINEFLTFSYKTGKFLRENISLINDDLNTEKIEIKDSINISENKKLEKRFEDKYLEKFKNFPNNFSFSELELKQENEEYIKIKLEYEENRFNQINIIKEKLSKIKEIHEKGNIDHSNENYTQNINDLGINLLIKFFDIEEEYYNDSEDFDLEELYSDLLKNKEELLKKLEETEQIIMSDEEMRKNAREKIINKKLDKLIDNYVLEYTPLGNIYMRFNNDKKSFEYFSNNTIPYRYLEPVGRKYVITYWCKPLFVDLEQELKKAEEQYDQEKKKMENEKKNIQEDSKNNPRKVLAQLKNYNKEGMDMKMTQIKNRLNKNSVLPPQIKVNLPDVNKPSEKQLLKENANRYTWEGRLTNFCPLKKLDRKIFDKKLVMSYADFKKIQQQKTK